MSHHFQGIGFSSFEMKWREFISKSRLRVIDLTVYILLHYLKFKMTWQYVPLDP